MSHSHRAHSTSGNSDANVEDHGGWKDILAGGISGGITRMLIAPLDVIKIRFQVQSNPAMKSAMPPSKYHYTGVIDSVRTIMRKEGVVVRFLSLAPFEAKLLAVCYVKNFHPRAAVHIEFLTRFSSFLPLNVTLVQAFWNGNMLAEMLYITYVGAQFGAYAVFQDRLRELLPIEKRGQYQSQISFTAGGAAALTAITATYPLDLLRTRFAAQSWPRTYETIPQAVRLIYASDGLIGFYSGWGPTCLSIVPSMALQFALYDWAKRSWFGGRESNNPIVHALGGALSGIVSKLAVLPLDVLKKQMQIQGLYHHSLQKDASSPKSSSSSHPSAPAGAAGARPGRSSLIQATLAIYRVEGFKGFFRGAVPSALKAGVSASLTFTCYEQAKILILSTIKRFEANKKQQ